MEVEVEIGAQTQIQNTDIDRDTVIGQSCRSGRMSESNFWLASQTSNQKIHEIYTEFFRETEKQNETEQNNFTLEQIQIIGTGTGSIYSIVYRVELDVIAFVFILFWM